MFPYPLVTITGADDDTDPKALVELSKRFPFVEWAILLSGSRTGEPRYPKFAWREAFYESIVAQEEQGGYVHVALHFCGAVARDFMKAQSHPHAAIGHLARSAARVQINGFDADAALHMPRSAFREVILQCSDGQSLDKAEAYALARPNGAYTVLFDASCGQGKEISAFPMSKALRLGYAGGINPTNLRPLLAKIHAAGAYNRDPLPWIDMETGVRTDNAFDLAKVESVLSQFDAFWQEVQANHRKERGVVTWQRPRYSTPGMESLLRVHQHTTGDRIEDEPHG